MRFQSRFYLVLTAAILLLLAPAARADVSTGLRGGISVNPDQFLFGGQLEFAPIAGLHAYDYTAAALAYKMLAYALGGRSAR